MKYKNLAARVISCCLILSTFFGIAAICSSAADVSLGGTTYVNFDHYCVEGKTSYVDEPTGPYYLYKKYNEHNTYLRMMYISDSSSGTPKTDNSGKPIWAYCIEFGQEVNTNLVRTAYKSSASDYFNSLPKEQQKGITLATLYGCPNETLGVATADAYAATQAIIWEYQTGIRTSTTEDKRQSVTYKGVTLEADRFYSMMRSTSGTIKQGLYAYDLLIEKIINHSKTPDFSTSKATLKFDTITKKYTCTLTDKNGVLSQFNITPKNSKLTVKTSGNKLTLTSDTEIGDTSLTFERKTSNNVSQSMLVLKAGSAGQVTVVGHENVPTTSTLNVSVEKLVIPTYSLSVYKKGEVLTSFNEEENGVNTPVYEEQYLDGCTLNLYADEDITTIDGKTHFKAGELVTSITTSKEGASQISGLYKGNYYLLEEEAPEGFIKSEERILISIGDTKNLDVTLTNERMKMNLHFTKLFEDEDEKDFSEVSFGVYTKSEMLDLPEGSLVDIINPDENGNCELNQELPLGYEYYIKELSTKEGYILDENEYTFSFVDFENDVVVGLEETDNIVNRLEPTTVLVTITEETPLSPTIPETTTEKATTTTTTTTTTVINEETPTAPNTGDRNNLSIYIALAVLGISGIYITKKK